MKKLYNCNKNVVLRTPYNSLEKYFELFGDSDQTEEQMGKLMLDKEFLEILFISTKSLFHNLQKNNTKNKLNKKQFYSCLKYIIRSTSRCTPYGLCAGVSLATLSTQTDIVLDKKGNHKKYVRVDMKWLLTIIKAIETDQNILPYLKMRVNSYLYEKGSRLINPWYIEFEKSDCSNTSKSIRNTPLVKYVLMLAKNPITYSELKKKIHEKYYDVPKEKIDTFLKQLIDNEILISELLPPLVNSEPLNYILNIIKDIPTAIEWGERLKKVQQLINEYSGTSVGEMEILHEQLWEMLEELNPNKEYLQVDLKKNLLKSNISNNIAEEAQEFIELLCNLADFNSEPSYISDFRVNFLEKYGFDIAVPILEVFDNDLGTGAPFGYTAPLSKQTGVDTQLTNTKLETYLYQKINAAIKEGVKEIVVTDKEIEPLKNNAIQTELLPKSLELCFEVFSETPQELDAGNFLIMPTGFIMSDFAEKSFGRFAYMFKEDYQEEWHDYEEKDVVTVEISEYPAHKRNSNVALCQSHFDYQLALNTPKVDSENYIDIHDVYMGIDSETNKFYLKSAKLNKRLSIRSSNLFNSRLGSNIYRFLEENNGLTAMPLVQSYYTFNMFLQPYVPRIVYKKIIIAPAKWKIPLNIIKAGNNDLLNYIKKWEIPRFVYFIEGDNKLLLDLSNKYHLQVLYDMGNKTFEDITLQEVINLKSNHWLKDLDGESYQNEIVLSFCKNDKSEMTNYLEPIVLQHKHPINDICHTIYEPDIYLPPAENGWIYLKLYGDKSIFDEIISLEIKKWCNNLCDAGILEKYFFIRYSDPDKHIRLRLKFTSSSNISFSQIFEWVDNLNKKYFISNVQVCSYHRETWRYGGKESIDMAETVFFRDSQLIEDILAIKKENDFSEDIIGIVNILYICTAFDMSPEDIDLWFSERISPEKYRKEFQENREEILEIIDRFYNNRNIIKNVDFTDRNNAIKKYKQLLDNVDDLGLLTASKSSILSSLIHMSSNRFKGNNTWEQKVRTLTRHGIYAYNKRKKYYK